MNKLDYWHLLDEYPFNLAKAILCTNDMDVVMRVYVPGLIERTEDLTERERNVLFERFYEKKTLERIARENFVTRERIRQIEAKALRKMRARASSFLLVPGSELRRAHKERDRLKLENITLTDRIRTLMESGVYGPDSIEEKDSNKILAAPSISIEDMELSVRSYNCLKRASIDMVDDTLTIDRLANVRNLGRKSIEEIVMRAAEHGIYIK